jgi:D-alanyl-lipoteichoic acid acyltransferase DltB (MBOAT superfamily)
MFSGLPFLLGFLPLVLAGSAIAGRFGGAWMKAWLIAASLVFYAIGCPAFLAVPVVSVLGNYAVVRMLAWAPRPNRWLVGGVGANVALLCGFKFLAPVFLVPGAIPLGISFFTFTQIGALLYFADPGVARPKLREYALFATFFPGLVAGPVLNAREIMPQVAGMRRLAASDLAVGSGFFLIGLLKKTLLADPFAPVVAAGFADPGHLTLFPAWQAACAFSLQLYFDFSGYTDMAIGLAWMFGLRFPDNFEQPYRARSVIAYWQRWHMSLTRFLMSTVHAPMTLAILRWRRRRGLPMDQAAQRSAHGFAAMIALPILLTMMLVAVWHGDRATFLLFGLVHTVFLLVNHGWRLFRMPPLPPVFSVALTYLCALAGAVIFRASTVGDAASVLSGMMGWHGVGLVSADPHAAFAVLWFAAVYAIVWLGPTTRQIMLSSGRFAWRESSAWALAMGGAATLGVLAAGGTGEFLYVRF